jgi:hypothetical protein
MNREVNTCAITGTSAGVPSVEELVAKVNAFRHCAQPEFLRGWLIREPLWKKIIKIFKSLNTAKYCKYSSKEIKTS